MKKLLLILTLILIANPMFAGKRDIVSETSTEAYRSYRLANQELCELGFKLSETKTNHYFIYEFEVMDKFYQVHVKLYNKKIRIDGYCFNSVKKQLRSKNYGQDVMNDIYKAIRFRVENNTSIPPIALLALWGYVIRNKDVE